MTRVDDFWSRRKAAVEAEAAAEQAAVEAHELTHQQAELEQKTDAELLAEFDLPDPDDLQPGDDVSGFMAKAIPDRLRRRALRRLWRLNPVLANVDGLVDYGEDFTDAACVVENIQTAYQVGKGMLAHIEALAAEAAQDDDSADTDAPDAPEVREISVAEVADDNTGITAPCPTQPPAAQSNDADTAPTQAFAEADEMQVAPAPRRMKFEFEG